MKRSSLPLALACITIALLGLVPQYLSRTIPDVAFPLWAAGRVLDGATLYVDILEINPPLFIWLDIPLVALARWTGLDPILVFRVAVTGLLVASLAGVVWVRGGSTARRLGSPTIETLAVVFALFVLPRLDWGEREHMALALMLPWIAVAVRRVEGREVSRRMALLTGLVAGIGIALKPHFVLVWLGRGAAIWIGARGGQGGHGGRVVQADTWAPVLVCVAYLGAAFAFTPEYFPLVRELAGPYSRFIRATVLQTMFGPAPALAVAALVVTVGLSRLLPAEPPNRRAATTVLWWTTFAWAVVALLQLKGFRYHWYPAMALGFLLLCQLALVARGVHISFASRLFRAIGTGAAVTCVVLSGWSASRQTRAPLAPEWDADPSIGPLLEALKERVEPGDTLAVLSPNMASGFPLTNYLGTVWPLRLPHVWPAIVSYTAPLERGDSPRLRSADAMKPLERWSVELVRQDLQRSQPEWLVVFRHLPQHASPHMAKLDLAAYLTRSDVIARLWQDYDSLGTAGMYSVWQEARHEELHRIGDVQWPWSGRSNLDIVAGLLFIAVVASELVAGRLREARRLPHGN